jgi:hypothetical protein
MISSFIYIYSENVKIQNALLNLLISGDRDHVESFCAARLAYFKGIVYQVRSAEICSRFKSLMTAYLEDAKQSATRPFAETAKEVLAITLPLQSPLFDECIEGAMPTLCDLIVWGTDEVRKYLSDIFRRKLDMP